MARLDLDPIKVLLRSRVPYWTTEQCELVEKWYRRFLTVMLLNPDASVEPITNELDEFWHQHILCTEKYVDDCDRVFGHYMHHAPTMPGDHRTDTRDDRFSTRAALEAFGEAVDELFKAFPTRRNRLAALVRD